MKAEEILAKERTGREIIIAPDHTALQYMGRMDRKQEEGPVWVYPATCVRLRFRGKTLRAVVTNVHAYWENSLGWLLDGVMHKGILQEEGITVLELGHDLGQDIHELCLFKRQDSCHEVIFHGFLGEDVELLEPVPLPERRIEVYGDSVSAGEVSEAEDYCGKPDPVHNGEYSNSYYSYAWMTARKLNACIHDIAQGGVALLDHTGWFMEGDDPSNNAAIGMESMFDKITYHPELLPVKEWDFSEYIPQVVIVAIGQNDSHPVDYMAEDPASEQAVLWKEHYARFLMRLRQIYPQAHIICTTTILLHHENWDRSIDEVCRRLGDEKLHHFLYSDNGTGTPGHIRRSEAEKMSDELSAYIRSLGEEIWK